MTQFPHLRKPFSGSAALPERGHSCPQQRPIGKVTLENIRITERS
jgi:hypothetical protein